MQEGERGAREVLDILGKPAAAAEPRKCPFDNPPLRENLEALCMVRALDDLELPIAERPHGRCRGRALISAIGENALDERELSAGFRE